MNTENRDKFRLLTTAQVAEIAQVHRTTVTRLIGRGELRAVRVGRLLRVSEAELMKFIESGGVQKIQDEVNQFRSRRAAGGRGRR